MKIFEQYRGMRREMYVLFFGRVVTSMGSLIWPMLTMILSNKLKMSAGNIASLMLILSLAQLPCTLIGGKLADRYNKRNIIIVCDLITITCFFICGFIPINMTFVFLFFIAGLFAAIEHPSYDALVADLTTSADRERAYSLNYLGMNLGIILAPTIGGFLFENYLNLAFILSSIATASSTLLIYIFIKDISRAEEYSKQDNVYECDQENLSAYQILRSRKILVFYLLCSGIAAIIYSQFNFLMPLNFERLYGAQGAIYFGLLTSVNGAVVIIGTPILTTLFPKIRDIDKMVWGEVLIGASLAMYIFIQGMLPMYFVSMVIFTIGEILVTLGSKPYLTRRVPATHRGRISSISAITREGFPAIARNGIGFVADTYSMVVSWLVVAVISSISVIMHFGLAAADRKEYALLYDKEKEAQNT